MTAQKWMESFANQEVYPEYKLANKIALSNIFSYMP
jgi:hypothetical protein